jgi:Kef-type K+ transport system membrane component KefB
VLSLKELSIDFVAMHDLSILAIIWTSVFVASFIAHRTRLTPVLWYLFLSSAMVNLGILPIQMPTFIVHFAELGIITIMFALGFERTLITLLKVSNAAGASLSLVR